VQPAIDIHQLGITPETGSPLGGESVRITGVAGGPGTTVTFGGVPALYVDSSAPPLLQVITPPGITGPVDVILTPPAAAAGTATPATQKLTFVYTELALSVVRPDDLLSLQFELVNLQLDGADLVRRDPAADAFVIVTFPPQHIAEGDFPTGTAPPAPPVGSVLAGPSQLAFRVPPATTRLPLTLDSLLAWDALALVPGPGAVGTPARPVGNVTALELPYRMILTVDQVLGWQLSPAPADPPAAVTELWRATMQSPSLRVAWSPELGPPSPLGPVTIGRPAPADRQSLAELAPSLISGDLTLSALGASIDMQAVLPPGSTSGIASWRHVIAGGRDSYVRLVHRGFLAPWGHRASVIEVTDREPETAADGSTVAALVSRTVVVVTEPAVSYASQFPGTDGKRLALPFVDVRITTLVTTLTDTTGSAVQVVGIGSDHFPFHLVATDHGGSEVNLTMPLVFVPAQSTADSQSWTIDTTGIVSTLQSLQKDALVDLGGQQVNFVPPPAAPAPAGTARARIAPAGLGTVANAGAGAVAEAGAAANAALLAVSTMRFTVDPSSVTVPVPNLSLANVTLPGAEALGAAAASLAISYHPAFLASGFSAANAGQVFAQVTNPAPLALLASAAGGLAAPALAVQNLSQKLGPVGNIASLLTNPAALQPTDIIGADTKLLGQLPLTTFLDMAGLDLDKLPSLVRTKLPNGYQVCFDWSPPLKSASASSALRLDLSKSSLTLHSESTVYTDGTPPRADVTGTLTNPRLIFFESVLLTLDVLAFTAVAGKKMDLTTGHLSIDLEGDLAFLRPLVQALPADGFSDPPYLDVTADGITAGFSAALPAIGAGILSIENLAVSATLSLPFLAPLGLKVAFSSREHPFMVTVAFIGGGGYFIIDVGADGIHQVEGSLELGAQLDVDLLIVTASVYVIAGFYFMVSQTGTSFSGFVRIGGSVDLLGLISVSVELYLALTYDSTSDTPSTIVGTASLTLSVHVLLVTKTLTLSVEKRFPVPGADQPAAPSAIRPAAIASRAAGGPGSPGPPALDSWLSIGEWRTYRQAFVAEQGAP
jgi:hypothetical protein